MKWLFIVFLAEDGEGDNNEDENKEEDNMNLTEEEENIYVSLTEGEHLQRDTVESILNPWWSEEPYRCEPLFRKSVRKENGLVVLCNRLDILT